LELQPQRLGLAPAIKWSGPSARERCRWIIREDRSGSDSEHSRGSAIRSTGMTAKDAVRNLLAGLLLAGAISGPIFIAMAAAHRHHHPVVSLLAFYVLFEITRLLGRAAAKMR
jgi:hypothetical protein